MSQEEKDEDFDNQDNNDDDNENDGWDDGDDGDDDDGWGDNDGDDGDDDWGDVIEEGTQRIDITKNTHQPNFRSDPNIPELTSRAITNNCIEVNMIPMFAATPDLKSSTRIGAIVAMRIDHLSNINEEQLEVWNIPPDYPYIALKFEFGKYYLDEGKEPKLECGLLKTLNPSEEMKSFRLSWTILERCKNRLLSKWPPEPKISIKEIPDVSPINSLIETTGNEYAVCLEALKQNKFNENNALNALLDPKNVEKYKKSIPSFNQCKNKLQKEYISLSNVKKSSKDNNKKEKKEKKKKKWWNNLLSKTTNMDKAKQLADIFQVPIEAALICLETNGYDKAVSELSDPIQKIHYCELAQLNKNNEDFYSTSMNQQNMDDYISNLSGTKRNSLTTNSKTTGNKFFGLFGKKNNNNNNNNKDETKEDELSDLKGLNGLTRTLSDNVIQKAEGKDLIRTLAVMLNHNFLLKSLLFAMRVLTEGNKSCMICDKKLEFAGLKPTICTDPFCQFRHDQVGLGFSLADEILLRPEITDLLISMCYAACLNRRIEILFPEGVKGLDDDTSHLSFFKNGSKDIDGLKACLALCPKLENMRPWASQGKKVLKSKLKEIHPLLYPLLIWIVTSNRAHFKMLPNDTQVKTKNGNDLGTAYQFALCSSTPQKEGEFQALQDVRGSFLAFHGSPMGNWHSILRMGLKNYSKTKHQMHGAAYGNGVYFASNFQTSVGYCKFTNNNSWPNSMFGPSISCMAVCEICYHEKNARGRSKIDYLNNTNKSHNSKDDKYTGFGQRITDPNNVWKKTTGIYVVADEKCITTRYFLLWKGAVPNKSVGATSLIVPNIVKRSN